MFSFLFYENMFSITRTRRLLKIRRTNFFPEKCMTCNKSYGGSVRVTNVQNLYSILIIQEPCRIKFNPGLFHLIRFSLLSFQPVSFSRLSRARFSIFFFFLPEPFVHERSERRKTLRLKSIACESSPSQDL